MDEAQKRREAKFALKTRQKMYGKMNASFSGMTKNLVIQGLKREQIVEYQGVKVCQGRGLEQIQDIDFDDFVFYNKNCTLVYY